MVKKNTIIIGSIFSLVIITILFFLVVIPLSAFINTNVYNFTYKDIKFVCTGSPSGEYEIDVDIRDGRISAKNQRQASSGGNVFYLCNSNAQISGSQNSFNMNSKSATHSGCGTSIICESTNFNLDNVKKVSVKMGGSVSINGNGHCGATVSRLALTTSLSCPNSPISESKGATNFELIKIAGDWIQHDATNDVNIPSDSQLRFSVSTNTGGGRTEPSAGIGINDIIIDCENGFILEGANCVEIVETTITTTETTTETTTTTIYDKDPTFKIFTNILWVILLLAIIIVATYFFTRNKRK